MLRLFYFVLLVFQVFSQKTFSGKCPFDKVTSVEHFNARKFEGTWYELERYHKNDNTDCVKEEYDLSIVDERKNLGKFTIKITERNLKLNLTQIELAELAETFNMIGRGQYFFTHTGWPYWIIYTDYNNFAIVWSCWDEDARDTNENQQHLAVLGRNPHFDVNKSEVLGYHLRKFDTQCLEKVNQKHQRCGEKEEEYLNLYYIKENVKVKAKNFYNNEEGCTANALSPSTSSFISLAVLLMLLYYVCMEFC